MRPRWRPHTEATKWLPYGLAVIASYLLALVAWALASPVGSSPDDDFHIANIYCFSDHSTCRSDDMDWSELPYPYWLPDIADRTSPRDEIARKTYPDLWPYPYLRELPCYVLNGTSWYAPNASVPADCLNAEDPSDNRPASVDNTDYYPSAYYPVLSLFTSDTIRKSVVTWRLVNIAIALGMAACSLGLTRARHRRPIAIGWLIASVPLGLFLVSSVNPSAWAIIGTAAMIGPALALLSNPRDRRGSSARIGFVTICALMAAGSRSEGAFLIAVAAMTVLILAWRIPSRRSHRIGLGLGLAGLLAAALLVGSRSDKLRGVVETALDDAFADPARQTASLWDTLLAAPGLYSQAHSPSLGWLEIGMPAAVGVLAGAAFWGAGFFGLSVVFRRKLIALLLLSGLMIAVPALILLNGQYLNARYYLPFVYVFAFVLLVPPLGGSLPEMSRAQKGALVLALAVANSLALLQTTVRYVSGLTMGATNPRAFAAHPVPEWWWDYWLSPFANWVLGSVAFAAGCFLLLRNPGPLYPKPKALETDAAGPVDSPAETAAADPALTADADTGSPTTAIGT